MAGEKRVGGRSARIQASVHKAAAECLAELDRASLTVPVIAARAGVPPSTIYRRWGDLAELLADVAAERFRPSAAPKDTGTLQSDLGAWAEQFAEEMSSEVGGAILRDVFAASSGNPGPNQCYEFIRDPIAVMLDRAARRGDHVPELADIFDLVVSPIMFRILFGGGEADANYCRALVRRVAALSMDARSR